MKIGEGWREVLKDEFQKEYFLTLKEQYDQERLNYTIFPPEEEIYSAFQWVDFSQVKVVIIGQDPYHGFGQANGLCFSVKEGVNHPPSLKNIYKELVSDLDIPYPKSGDLTPWAEQGVLLLNATLTVRESEANSHSKIGWQKFTDAVIRKISEEKEGVVFLLWGGFAKKKGAKINKEKHYVLVTGHPSPLSANRGFWYGNKHFSLTNTFLKSKGEKEIDWMIN